MQEFQYIQDILKDSYAPAVVNQLPTKAPVWGVIKKKSVSFQGKRHLIPVVTGWPESVGARAANNYGLPTAQRSAYDQAEIAMKRVYGRVSIDGFAIESSKGKGGWVEAFTKEIENITNGFAIQLDRMTMMDGKGRLALVNGAPAAQVITVDSPGGILADVNGLTKYLRKGMVIDIYDAAGNKHADSVQISAVDSAAGTITVVGNIAAVVDNDIIYAEDTYEANSSGEIMGLEGIVSTANTPGATFEGIDRAAVEEWQAYVRAVGGVLSETVLQEGLDAIEARTDGNAPNFSVTTTALRNKLISIMQSDRQVVNTLDLKAGWKALKYVGGSVELPILAHPRCPTGYIYLLSLGHLKFYTLKSLIWDDRGGGVMKPVANYDAYEAWFKLYANLGTDCSNAHGKLTGVTTV